MPSTSVRYFLFPAVAIAGAWLSAASGLAADDGQAPIWVGVSNMLGLDDAKEELPIEYRERSKLVLPPKMVLPAPAAAPVTNLSAWPVDPDVQRVIERNKEKQSFAPHMRRSKTKDSGIFSTDGVVTVRADAGQGPATKPCVTGSPSRDCQNPGWSIFSQLGFGAQSDTASLGPEPDRTWLTDPPKGYRATAAAAPAVK